MKQQCYLAVIYLNWAVFAAGLILLGLKGQWPLFVVWLVVLPIAGWAYIRVFPSISRFMGYGTVADKAPTAAAPTPASTHGEVTIYTALGCPFCPIVKDRLIALSQAMGFRVKEVDVTLKPAVLVAKGIRALPVVECGTWRVEGNATSERLASVIAGSHADESVLAR